MVFTNSVGIRDVVLSVVLLVAVLGSCHGGQTSTEVSNTNTTIVEEKVLKLIGKEPEHISSDQPQLEYNTTSTPPQAPNREDDGQASDSSSEAANTDKGTQPLEVSDMMKDPYRNETTNVPTTVNSDTMTVEDPHVINTNKTHEEDSQKQNDTSSTKDETNTKDEEVKISSKDENTITSSKDEAKPSTKEEEKTSIKDEATTKDDASTKDEAKTSTKEEEKTSIKDQSTTKDEAKTSAKDEGSSNSTEEEVYTDLPATEMKPQPTKTPPVLALVVDHNEHDHLSLGKSAAFSQPTVAAGILAGILISLAVAGYLGLIAWRKMLERRYGNREMLVNEDDDLSHFEL